MPDNNVLLYCIILVVAGGGAWYVRRLRSQIAVAKNTIKNLQLQSDAQRQQQSTEKNELKAILSSMVEGVLVIGKDEKIQYVSPNISDMFDFRSKEVEAKPYWEVIGHAQIIAAIKEALTTSKAVAREITIIANEDVVFNIQISPVLNDGKLQGAVAVFHDITEFKKLLRMRSEFVANVSHELKTPLTSIKGYVETLNEPGALNDMQTVQAFLKIIAKQTMRLEALVKDLLTLSAIESKEVSMDVAPVDAAVIINNALAACKSPLDAAGHSVKVSIEEGLPKVVADKHRMEQVFINLIDNAIKFTPAKGKIDIKVQHENPYIRVDVKDSGVGFASQHNHRLFERFYRVDKSRSAELGGTGLGLAIVKHIVLAHQGKVEAQSQVGAGSTFSVFLPALSP